MASEDPIKFPASPEALEMTFRVLRNIASTYPEDSNDALILRAAANICAQRVIELGEAITSERNV